MGQVKWALTLSTWRKLVYFVALFLLPLFGPATIIFYAEPISDILACTASLPVHFLITPRILKKRESSSNF